MKVENIYIERENGEKTYIGFFRNKRAILTTDLDEWAVIVKLDGLKKSNKIFNIQPTANIELK